MVKMSSHKTFMIKKLGKKQRKNKPIPYWIRTRIDNTISFEILRMLYMDLDPNKYGHSDNLMTNRSQLALLRLLWVLKMSKSGGHSAAISENGHLYVWGRPFCGASDIYRPHRVTANLYFSKVALRYNHALVLTGDGEVYAWRIQLQCSY